MRDQKSFENAKDKNTIDAFTEVILNYPVSSYTDSLLYYYDSLLYADNSDNKENLRTFLFQRPSSVFYTKALKQFVKLEFEYAIEVKSIDVWNTFINDFPISPLKEQALIYRDNLIVDEFERSDNEELMNKYLYEYPSLLTLNDALNTRDSLAFVMAEYDYDIESYDNYIYKYPNSLFKQKAIESRNELAFETAKSQNSKEAFEEFVLNYPFAQQVDTALAIINRFNSTNE